MSYYRRIRSLLWALIFVVLVGTFVGLIGNQLYAEGEKSGKKESEVKISWEEFKRLLKIDVDEVKLSWDEFKKILAQTGSDFKVEYNIQDGMVVLKRAQFKRLLDQMKPPDVTPIQPPSDYLITKAEYSGSMKKKSTNFNAKLYLEIFKKERTAYPRIRILPQSVALKEIEIDNVPGVVMNEGGWYVLTTDKIGQHVIDLKFSVESALDKGPDALNLNIPQTAITLFKLSIPLQKVDVDIPQAKHMTTSRIQGATRIDAVLSPTSYINVKMHRKFVVEKKKGPAKIYAETMNLLSIEEDALRVNSRIKLNILQNGISSIKMSIPKGYSVLYVRDGSWQEMRDWTTKKARDTEILTVPFDSDKEGTVILNIVSEKLFSEEKSEIEFSGFRISKAIRETGYIGAEKKSTSEAEIVKTDNIDRIDIQELPIELVNMSAKPLIFGLRYLRHPYLLTLNITKHEELPTVSSVIDNASVMSVLLEEGKVVTRVVYTMRNTWKQFLEIKLPENAEIWSLYVNGKRELPSKNKEGVFMIPLVRSTIQGEYITPFNIEILYYNKIKKFSIGGSRRIDFPTADVVTSKMLWSCYLPVNYRFIHFGGNVEKEKIATGIRPLLGSSRVFDYENVNGYTQVLESYKRPSRAPVGRKVRKWQKSLQSEFKTALPQSREAFLGQMEQEINFARNIQEEQQKGVIAPGGAGVALLKIEVPTSGQLYRFAKTLVEGENLYLNFQYVRGWIRTIITLVLIGIGIYVIYLLRVVIKNLYLKAQNWVVSHKTLWDRLKSPQGLKLILAACAIIFLFLSRFLFVIFVLLFIVAWFRPEWLIRRKADTGGEAGPPQN